MTHKSPQNLTHKTIYSKQNKKFHQSCIQSWGYFRHYSDSSCFKLILKSTISPPNNRKSPESANKKKGKVGTKWDLSGTSKDAETLNFGPEKGDEGENGEIRIKDEEVAM